MCKKIFYLLALVLVLDLIVADKATAADPNLVGSWKLDETSGTIAYDSSGGGNNGTLNGNPPWVAGYRDGALQFDGTDDYVSFPRNNFGVLIRTLKECTFSIWVNWSGRPDPAVGGWQRIFDIGSATANYIYLCPSTGAANAAMRVAIVAGNGIWDEFDASTGPLPTGWHHIAVTVSDSSKAIILYLDSNVVGSKTNCTNSVDDLGRTGNNWLGRSQYPADPYFNGILDDFKIYNRVLSQAEIRKVANPERASIPIPPDGSIINLTAVNLQWQAGTYAVQHHVYFGENLSDVDQGTGGTDKGLTSSTTYPLTNLEPALIYYWRIDEVNDLHPDKLWRGDIWSFTVQPLTAYNPSPPDGAVYVDPNDDLAWSAGAEARSHDVYLGTDFDTVNDASRANPLGVLVKQNHDANTYEPGTLAFDTTYYWRIDEVNGVNNWKGDVWEFRTELFVPITDPNLVGWWKLDDGEGMMAVDSSGHYNHGTLINGPQWAAGWIRGALQFDGIDDYVSFPIGSAIASLTNCTLATWVNWSGLGDPPGYWQKIINFGTGTTIYMYLSACTDTEPYPMYVAITTQGAAAESTLSAPSTLATGWHHVAVVLEPGSLQLYLDGQVFGRTSTSYVLSDLGVTTDNWLGRSEWPNDAYFNGFLDDFRIYNCALTQAEILNIMRGDLLIAWNPSPAQGSTPDIEHVAPLSWMPGENAVQHYVYFGTDPTVVGDANEFDTTGVYRGRQLETTYTPSEALQQGQTYYWRIDEYNTDATISKGMVWSLTVADYLIVDDFEGYTNDVDSRAFQTWLDGYGYTEPAPGYGGNGTGSAIGYATPPFMETDIVHGGVQSVPFSYNNTGQTGKQRYSETDREFAAVQDFTRRNSKALTLYFYGAPINVPEQLYVALEDSGGRVAVIPHGDPDALTVTAWQEWNIALSDFTAVKPDLNLQSITKMQIGVGDRVSPTGGGTGLLYLDDIRLYPTRCVPSLLQPDADLSTNCVVDYDDIVILVERWLDSDLIVTPVAPSNSNLVGHWKFDDGSGPIAADSSGNANNGTLPGDPQWVAGHDGGALWFDGADDYVELPIGSLIRSLTNSSFTTWADFSNAGGGWQRIFDFGTGLEVYMFLSPRIETAGPMRFAVTTTGNAPGAEDIVDALDTLASGWHHVAVTIDADNDTITLYLDGLMVDQNTEATLSPSDLGQTTQNWLGRSRFAADGYYTGLIDDFRIYSRALSAAEVAQLADRAEPFSIPADLYEDGVIDLKDFAVLADLWLEELLWPQP